MAKNFVIVEADSLEEAVAKGCANLKVGRDDVEVRVLTPGQRGIIFSTPYKVKVIVKSEKGPGGGFSDSKTRILSELTQAERLLGNRDGSISFEKDPAGVWLTVQPPAGDGRGINIDEVYRSIQEDATIINVDSVAVNRAFQPQNYGQRLRIADYLREASEDRDAEVTVSLSADAMEARIRVTPPAGNGLAPNRERITAALRAKGIQGDLDAEAIGSVVDARRYNEEVVVARGVPSEHGQDSDIQWLVGELDKKETQVVRADGSVDFRKIYELNNVRAKTLLGVLKPATPGTDGRDLYGKPLVAKPGKDRPVRVGKNVRVAAEGDKLYAEIDGQFSRENAVGSVLPVFEVAGDLDLKVGDIDFFGTVMIHGHVQDGFTVKAGGNVFVMGTVGEATIVAGGQVIVSAGFLGKSRGSITAGSSVLVKFAEGGQIEAGENLVVDNAIMNCQVRCGGRVEVKSGKAQIVGGNIQARDEITAKNIGTAVGTKTYVTVGIDLLTREKLDRLGAQQREATANLDKLMKSRNHLRGLTGNKELPPTAEQTALLEKIERMVESLEARVDELQYEKETLEAAVERRRRGSVRAEGSIYSGVHVTIRSVTYHVKDEIKASALVLDGDDVRISPL